MKYVLSIAALLLAMSQQPASAQESGNLVKQAVAAEGGAELRALKGLAIKGDAKFWEPGQSFVAAAEPRFLGDATFAITWDLANGRARTAWDRDQKYPEPAVKIKYTETVLPALGYVTDEKSSQAMSGIRVATHQRELERASPWLLVKAMGESGKVRAAGSQRLGQPRSGDRIFRRSAAIQVQSDFINPSVTPRELRMLIFLLERSRYLILQKLC